MPCGGIYPVRAEEHSRCWVCNKGNADHWIEEWDCGLHYECFGVFCRSDEFDIILGHKHNVELEHPDVTKYNLEHAEDK